MMCVEFYTKKNGKIKLFGEDLEVYDKVDKTDILKAYEIFEEVF